MKKYFMIGIKVIVILIIILILIIPSDFFIKNYLQRWISNGEETEKLNLEYIDSVEASQCALSKEEWGFIDDLPLPRQLWGDKELKEKTGYESNKKQWGCGFGNVYIISYGYKISDATYTLSKYNGRHHGEYTSEFDSEGYWIDFTFDTDEYFEEKIFIYKCDRVIMGNSVYSY